MDSLQTKYDAYTSILAGGGMSGVEWNKYFEFLDNLLVCALQGNANCERMLMNCRRNHVSDGMWSETMADFVNFFTNYKYIMSK